MSKSQNCGSWWFPRAYKCRWYPSVLLSILQDIRFAIGIVVTFQPQVAYNHITTRSFLLWDVQVMKVIWWENCLLAEKQAVKPTENYWSVHGADISGQDRAERHLGEWVKDRRNVLFYYHFDPVTNSVIVVVLSEMPVFSDRYLSHIKTRKPPWFRVFNDIWWCLSSRIMELLSRV